MKRVFLILLFLAGCSQLPSRVGKEQHQPQVADDIIREAISLRVAGRWAESLALLEKTNSKHPGNTTLMETLRQTRMLHNYEIRTLEDRILALEANTLKEKASILKKIAEINPGNYSVGTRLYFLNGARKRGVNGLVACGRYHKWKNQPLSQHCLQLANEQNPSAETQLLLDEVGQRIESVQDRQVLEKQFRDKKRRREKQVLLKDKIKKDQVKNNKKLEKLLTVAEENIGGGSYELAAVNLKKIEVMSPQDSRLYHLKTQLKEGIDKQIEELDRAGDRLYREEQVEQAVSAWESALDLDPDRKDITAKIERAMKILTRLETLQVKKPKAKE